MSSKTVIFSHGDKGGVGKSLVCATLVDLLIEDGVRVALVDGDTDNADVAQRFEGSGIPLTKIRLSDFSEYETAVNRLVDFAQEAIERHGTEVIVVNLPAGASATVDRDPQVIEDALGGLGAEARVILSLGNSSLSLQSLNDIKEKGMGTVGPTLALAPKHFKDDGLLERLKSGDFDYVSEFPRLEPDSMRLVLENPEMLLKDMTDTRVNKSPILRIRIDRFRKAAREIFRPIAGEYLKELEKKNDE
ncbi:MAG: hypothetical protein KGZ50_09580 [Peptococcaceae bacterium]|nr:hypothetical protein [Peptococcaceae bacterium]